MTVRDRLAEAIAASVPPFDRLQPCWGAVDTPLALMAERRRTLCSTLEDRREGAFRNAYDVSEEDLQRCCSNVALLPDHRPPAWVSALYDAFEYFASLPAEIVADMRTLNVKADDAASGWRILSPWGYALVARLWPDLAALPNGFGDEVPANVSSVVVQRLYRSLVGWCSERVRTVAAITRALGVMPADGDIQIDVGPDGWLDWFEEFPALPFVVGTALANATSYVAEMAQRLCADMPQLEQRFFGGHSPGRLMKIHADAGDIHDGGRAVVLLWFEGGNKLVYKPKDLRIAHAVNELSTILNAGMEGVALHTRTILVRGEYTWEEWVDFSPVDSPAGVESFYRNYGAMVRLFEFLEARDCWLDNVVAAGDMPVCVDLEMMLQPRLIPIDGLSGAEVAASDMLEDTCVPTGLITMPMIVGADSPAEEMGGLARVRRYSTPFSASNLEGVAADDRGRVTWEHPEHAPHLSGQPVSVDGYEHCVARGYEACGAALRNARRDAAVEAILDGMMEMPVRYIFRDTWTCQQVGYSSTSSHRLSCPYKREEFFSRLFVYTLGSARASAEAALVRSEIEAFRIGDVPLFFSFPHSEVAFSSSRRPLATLFRGTAAERLRRRLHTEASTEPLRTAALRTALWFVRTAPLAAQAEVESRAGEGAEQWAEQIARWSFGDGHSSASWLVASHHPSSDIYALEVMRSDLAFGTSGLACMYADLHRLYGGRSWSAWCSLALHRTRADLAEFVALSPRERAQRSRRMAGAWYGPLANLLALHHCRESDTYAPDEPELYALSVADLLLMPPPETYSFSCGTRGGFAAAIRLAEHYPAVAASVESSPWRSDTFAEAIVGEEFASLYRKEPLLAEIASLESSLPSGSTDESAVRELLARLLWQKNTSPGVDIRFSLSSLFGLPALIRLLAAAEKKASLLSMNTLQ